MNAKQAKAKSIQIRADKNMENLKYMIDMAVSEGVTYCCIDLGDLDDQCKEYLDANGFKYKQEEVIGDWENMTMWEISWD
jgi:predicted DNA-binding protein with PD1-like motif